MMESLLDAALRGVSSTDEFLDHLQGQASRLRTNGQFDALKKLENIIASLKELRDFESGTVDHLNSQETENEDNIG